jgi:uncharacterized protein YbbC (DUF1343 family)
MRRRTFLRSAAAAAAGAAGLARAAAAPLPAAGVTLGDEVFLRESWRELRGRTIGIITNQTGVTSRLQTLVDAVRARPEIRVRAIYAPEHGFRGDRPAGSYVPSYTDEATGLPVYSLYGPTRHPSAAMLEGVDVLVYDIQDVGSRAYTFISTMAYAMQSAKEAGKEFWVLDRPNPVGSMVEGPVLEPAFASFIGLYPIAMRHGMTVGELAKLFNEHFGIGAQLRVVPMRGYTREMIWPQTGLQWVQSSPNIPDWQTTFPYLCTGLIDNLGINNGVGTAKPFFYAGMVGLDGDALARALNARNLPGIFFRAASWSPFAGFWLGKELHGVELVIFDPSRFEALRTAVEIAVAVREVAPKVIDIKKPADLDRDWGTDSFRKELLAGNSADDILAGWRASTTAFKALREKYLLYP